MKETIPPEITKFFENVKNAALLIKGEPGSGKTIFSLQYIANQAKKGCGIYFSTRVDVSSLYSQFPWIKESIPPENIVDATQSVVPKKMEVSQFIGFSSLPEFLKGLYTVIEEKISAKFSPIVAVDSIDAVASFVGLSVEETCAKIIDVVKNTGIRTLIITERTERTALDYICDGVLAFKKKFIDERLFRELVIEKLRGVEIKNPTYYFTLHDGKFRFFDEFRPIELTTFIHEPHPPVKDGKGTKFYEKNMFSTGSKIIDKIVGGYKRGSFVLLEATGEVPPEFIVENVAGVPVENFLMQDRGVVVVPCKGLSPLYFFEFYAALVGREKVQKNCKIIIPSEEKEDEKQFPWLVYTSYHGDHFVDTVNKVINEFKKEKKDNILLFLSFDKIESDFGHQNAEKIAMKIISRVKFEKDLCIGATFPSTKINVKLRETADYFFKIFSKKGRAFIYGVSPPTVIYNANIDFSGPHPTLYFTPIT